MGQEKPRQHSHEFRVEIAQRMLNGGCVKALSEQYHLPRSMMYRWRDAYRKDGPEGLRRPIGRPPGSASRLTTVTKSSAEEKLRQRIGELERTIGRQSVEIDFFKGVFKRLEAQPKALRRGGAASTRRSDE
jgi:transposase-like protein